MIVQILDEFRAPSGGTVATLEKRTGVEWDRRIVVQIVQTVRTEAEGKALMEKIRHHRRAMFSAPTSEPSTKTTTTTAKGTDGQQRPQKRKRRAGE